MASTPRHGLLETMHTAFGKPCLVGKTSHTLRTMVTKTLEKLEAFGKKIVVAATDPTVLRNNLRFICLD